MKQSLSFLTIGVNDLQRMRQFYTAVFGWSPVKDSDGIVFYKLNGLMLALFPAGELAEDIGILQDGTGFRRMSMAMNFRSEQEVDEVYRQLQAGGAKGVRAPEKVYWGGYRGYIADPEDNYWELAYNPFLELDDSGNVVSHQ